MKLSEIDLNDLDLSSIGSWPLPARVMSLLLVAAIIFGIGYAIDTSSQLSKLDSFEKKESEIKLYKDKIGSLQGKYEEVEKERDNIKEDFEK